MAVKDIKLYFDQVVQDYHNMLEEIREFEVEAQKGLIEPERLDQIKETIKPLVENYQYWSYVMFLLNQPVKKHKQARYKEQNKKLLASFNKYSKENISNKNNEVINDLKKVAKGEGK